MEERSEPINEVNNNSQRIEDSFVEIAPLNYEIENTPQKDLSSIPIKDLSFPKIVYMIVDNKIELITKLLILVK